MSTSLKIQVLDKIFSNTNRFKLSKQTVSQNCSQNWEEVNQNREKMKKNRRTIFIVAQLSRQIEDQDS